MPGTLYIKQILCACGFYERERDCKLRHSFETDLRKKNSGLYNTKGKNKR